jgi:hypothetical protein
MVLKRGVLAIILLFNLLLTSYSFAIPLNCPTTLAIKEKGIDPSIFIDIDQFNVENNTFYTYTISQADNYNTPQKWEFVLSFADPKLLPKEEKLDKLSSLLNSLSGNPDPFYKNVLGLPGWYCMYETNAEYATALALLKSPIH